MIMKGRISKFVFGALVLSAILYSCTKDKIESKPNLFFSNFSSDVVSNPGRFTINFRFTDREGDLVDTFFLVQRRTNRIYVGSAQEFTSYTFQLPAIPDNTSEAEIQVRLAVNTAVFPNELGYAFPTPVVQNDSSVWIAYLKDRAGNVSDTLITPTLVVLR